MEDELWMRKIKDRLEDYSEPVPASGWERLEKDLSGLKSLPTEKRRIIPFRRWAMSAAAVLLVAVSSISLWLLQSPVGDEMRNTAVPSLAVAPDILPEQQAPGVQTEMTEPVYRAQGKSLRVSNHHNSLVAQQIRIADKTEQQEEIQIQKTEEETAGNVSEDVESVTTENKVVDSRNSNTERQVERRRPSSRDKLHLPVEKKSHAKSRGWSVGLSVGNTGGLVSGNGLGEGDMLQSSPSLDNPYGGKVDLSTMANGIMNVPEGQELIFKDGMPYLKRRADQVVNIDHKQPLTFGFSVRKRLPKGFSVETGLMYTYLASDVEFASSEKVSQKLHYLGIPLRANWNFIDKKAFTMYVSAGGAMEKCVYGKIGSKDETVKPLQFSVMGAVGAQYNVSNRVGIYVEPGVSYFFDDGSEVQTIRKENPCNFTLQGGIRLTY